jgi:outer membrane immunogenic protein
VNIDPCILGVQVGYQHQFGKLVLGVEANAIAMLEPDGTVDCPNAARFCKKEITDMWSVGPRIGLAMGSHMPYLTGGYARASVDHVSGDKPSGANGLFGRARLDGWYLGGGVDWAVKDGVIIGIEYRHYELDGDRFQTFSAAGAVRRISQPRCPNRHDIPARKLQVRPLSSECYCRQLV